MKKILLRFFLSCFIFSPAMCFWAEMFSGFSNMTNSICGIFVKQAEVDGKKIELGIEQIKEQMKACVNNDKLQEEISSLRKNFEEQYHALSESSEKNSSDIDIIKATLDSFKTTNNDLLKSHEQLKENQKNLTILIGSSLVVVGGILLYKSMHRNPSEVRPGDFETKQKALQQMKASREAYVECQKFYELSNNNSNKNCNDIFEDFLKADKFFCEAFAEYEKKV